MNSFLRNHRGCGLPGWAATLGLAILLLASPRSVRAQSEFMILNWPILPPAFVGYEYSVPLWATGGTEPYSWELAGGTLPSGLTIERAGAIRSRTDLKPTQSGLFSFTVQARDSGGRVASRDFVLRIFNTGPQTLAVLTHDLGVGTPGQPIEEYLDALGGSPPYTWSLSGGQLPPGVRLESAGRIVGTPVGTGDYKSYAFQVTATDTVGATATASLVMTTLPSSGVAVTTPSRIRGLQGLVLIMHGIPGASPLRVSGGTAPYQWLKLLGNLPPELTFNVDGSISGTPATLGSFTFLVAVLDSQSNFGWRFFTLLVLPAYRIETASLAGGTLGATYDQQTSVSGGIPPYLFGAIDPNTKKLLSNNSPAPGLVLDARTGRITGTPTSTGRFDFELWVWDNPSLWYDSTYMSRPFTLTIAGGTPGTLTVNPTALSFRHTLGDPVPASQNVSVSSGSAALSFTLSAATASGGNWLSASPSAGTTPATLSVSVNPPGLAAGEYAGTLTITAPGASNSPQRVTVQLSVQRTAGPDFSASGVVNGAHMGAGPVAPGEIISIFGSGLGPETLTGLRLNEFGQVATSLVEVQVTFDNIPAPLLFVQARQLSAIVPYAVAGTTDTRVQVQYKGLRSSAVTLKVTPSAPGVFTLDSSGKGPGAILNENFTVNTATNRAQKGSVVILYATGEGSTDPQVADGLLASPQVLPKPRLPVSVKIGGLDAEVLYAGSAPGLVVGLLQVNVRIPPTVPSGSAVPVLLTIGGASSQAGVTMAVQ